MTDFNWSTFTVEQRGWQPLSLEDYKRAVREYKEAMMQSLRDALVLDPALVGDRMYTVQRSSLTVTVNEKGEVVVTKPATPEPVPEKKRPPRRIVL